MTDTAEFSVTTALAPVQQDVLAIDADTPLEMVALLIDRVEAAKRFAKQLDGYLKDKLIELVKERGPILINDMLYRYASKKLPPKCNNVAGALDALLEREGGDVEAVCEKYLSAGAIKYGAAKSVLTTEQYASFFVDGVYEDELKKELIKTDTKYLK